MTQVSESRREADGIIAARLVLPQITAVKEVHWEVKTVLWLELLRADQHTIPLKLAGNSVGSH
jgi:hypothetical protein